MTSETEVAIELGRPWEASWSKDDLETISKCPVCGETNRRILHADLVDNTFFCAPGVWMISIFLAKNIL